MKTPALARDSVGPSWESYRYAEGLWALPVDAATQVASYRPDLLEQLSSKPAKNIRRGSAVGAKGARQRQIHSRCGLSHRCNQPFLHDDRQSGSSHRRKCRSIRRTCRSRAKPSSRLHALIAIAHPQSTDWNPIQMYDHMVAESDAVYCPWAYGYSNYSRRENSVRLKFTNAPAAGESDAPARNWAEQAWRSASRVLIANEAVAYAKWLASPQHQRGTYVKDGGQPASLSAWLDPEVDAAACGFFSETLETLQKCLRAAALRWIRSFFRSRRNRDQPLFEGRDQRLQLIDSLNKRFAESSRLGARPAHEEIRMNKFNRQQERNERDEP